MKSVSTPEMRCLLLLSADMESDRRRIELGQSPRRDYIELANELGATFVDAGEASRRRAGRLTRKVLGGHSAIVLAAQRYLGEVDVVFTDNERLGVLFAMTLRLRPRSRVRLVMLAHHLTPAKKRTFVRLARPAITSLIVHSVPQKRLAEEKLGFEPSDVIVLPYQVDTIFWHPCEGAVEDVVSSAGLEFRDYDTLLAAANGLDISVAVGAASSWSRKRNSLSGRELPSWFAVGTYDYVALRDLYWRSRFVVAPLAETDFQAGVTLILEAMACRKAVLVSHTAGQREVVRGPVWRGDDSTWPVEGPRVGDSTGIYVPPGDVSAMRAAMRFMLTNPKVCAELGENGRRLVEQEFTVELFAKRFASAIAQAGTSNRRRSRII